MYTYGLTFYVNANQNLSILLGKLYTLELYFDFHKKESDWWDGMTTTETSPQQIGLVQCIQPS